MLSPVHVCPGTECQKKSPTDAGSDRKVSLTKGDYKVGWTEPGRERRLEERRAGPDPGAWHPP